MASGSFAVNTSNKYIKGTLSWSSKANNSGNYSDVTVTLRMSRTNTGYTTLRTPQIKFTVNGVSKQVNASSQVTIKYNSNTNCGTWTTRVNHNDSGSKSISIWVTGTLVGSTNYSVTNTGKTVALDTIPRYAKITSFTLTGERCNQFIVTCKADRAVDVRQYKIGSGSWTNMSGTSVTVTGRSPATKYSVYVRVRSAASGLYTTSGAKSITTLRLTTATGPTFNTNNNFTVSLSRASTSISHDLTLQIWGDSQKWVSIATRTQISTSYTFVLTQAELNKLYSNRINMKTSSTRIHIQNRWGHGGASQGVSYSTNGTVTIGSASPTLSGVSYKDVGEATLHILGNNQKILRNMSYLRVIAGTATSQKSATLKRYTVSIGGKTYTTNTSGTSESGKIISVGKVDQSADQTAVLTVIDSRGYTASRSFKVQMLNYEPPQLVAANAERLNNYEEPSSLYITARRSVVIPDSTEVNSLQLRYRIKQNPSGSYGNWTDISLPEGYGGGLWQNFNIDQYIADYPNDRSYTIELGIRDIFTNWNTILITLPEGIALMRFFKDLIEIGTPLALGSGREALSLEASKKENTSWISFYKRGRDERRGYVGFGSTTNDDIYMYNDKGKVVLYTPSSVSIVGPSVSSSEIDKASLTFPTGRRAEYIPTGNANTVVDEWVLISGSNTPSSGYFYIHTIIYATSAQRLQLAYSYSSTNTAYMRHLYNGVWSNWTALHT